MEISSYGVAAESSNFLTDKSQLLFYMKVQTLMNIYYDFLITFIMKF